MEATDLSYYQQFVAEPKNAVRARSDDRCALVAVDPNSKLMTMMTPKTMTMLHLNAAVWMAFDLKTILREHVPL